MTSAVEEEGDSVLSDVEGDSPSPIAISNLSHEDVSLERWRELLSELERERQAREAAEASKSELQLSFNRLKVLAHDAIRKRDEISRQRDEAVRERDATLKSNQKISADLDEIVKSKDDLLKQMDDCSKKLEDVELARDSLRSEIEASAHMLVSGTDKISGKISSFKHFGAGGLPKSSKYSGLPAVAYGVIKRSNEIVEELLRHMEATAKSRDGAQELMEQKNYENAIEVSQLEAAIIKLRKDESERNCVVEALEKSVLEKDAKISEVEKVILVRALFAENEATRMKDLLEKSEKKIDICSSLLADQLNCISKINDELCNVIKIVDTDEMYQSELLESFFPPQPTDLGGNLRVCNARMNSVYELTVVVVDKVRCSIGEKCQGMKDLNDTVTLLVKEKQNMCSLLRTMLSKRLTTNSPSKVNLEIGREYKLNNIGSDQKCLDHVGELNTCDGEDDARVLVGALDDTIKSLHIKIIERGHTLDELRAEFTVLEERMAVQSIELNNRNHYLEELQEKERVAMETIEGLMFDIATSEEEISRWKAAAEQEAIAGKAIEQESEMQMRAIRKEMEEAKGRATESEKKVKLKEEMAAAAITARDAAEKSVIVGDMRAARLRRRVEELARLLDGSAVHHPQPGTNPPTASRYACWPWRWLGLDFVAPKHPSSSSSSDPQGRGSNEMELSEPFI